MPPRGASGSPTIQIGAPAQHIDREVGRPSSRTVPDRTPRHPERVIDLPLIDARRTRRERKRKRQQGDKPPALSKARRAWEPKDRASGEVPANGRPRPLSPEGNVGVLRLTPP